MAYEPKDMSGVLFKNDKKKSDKAPDYTGNVIVHGQKFQLAAWVKTARNDSKFMSIAVKDESDQTNEHDYNNDHAPSKKEDNDDMPF
jgi:uncharacterized protein (DUF736 family)